MAQTSWPFENIDTTEVQFSQWARHINEGIRPDFANELEPFADDSGLNVTVRSGQAMVRGHYYASTAEETLTITTPDATNPRIDSVVLELDIVANSILQKVVAGTPDASPVAPTLTQSEDGNVYQFLLGNVDVAAGVFSIEAGDVTDLRTYMFQGVGKWTTDTRPENPIDYQTIGYNTDLNTHEVWNGSAWTSVFAPITTEGDLAIGDNTGTAVRLPIGAADTVLTSNGTTATWVEAAGGGENFVGLPYNQLSIIDVNFASNSIVRFAIVTTSTDPFLLNLFDSSDNLVTTLSVDRDNPFTYFTNAIAVAKIGIFQDVVNEEPVLVFSDATDVSVPPTSAGIVTTITTTQSVTLATDHIAYCFGAGGGGGGVNSKYRGAGGGGGSGFIASGTVTAGTYTATVGAGGSSGTGNGGGGGTTSIGTVFAAGGGGGSQAPANVEGGNGGNGGSGGGGGAAQTNDTYPGSGAAGGRNGADGTDGVGNGTPGLKGIGSGDVNPAQAQIVQPAGNSGGEGFSFITNNVEGSGAGFYAAGCGGNLIENGRPAASASGFAGGGNGAVGTYDAGVVNETGGTGKAGFIILVEA